MSVTSFPHLYVPSYRLAGRYEAQKLFKRQVYNLYPRPPLIDGSIDTLTICSNMGKIIFSR
jgi:hypothetical protein